MKFRSVIDEILNITGNSLRKTAAEVISLVDGKLTYLAIFLMAGVCSAIIFVSESFSGCNIKRSFTKVKMNYITLHGRIIKNAEKVLVHNTDGAETPLVKFSFQDNGLPYQKSEPMFIEVHFMKAAAVTIEPYLKKGRVVDVFGCLRAKTYAKNGETKQKYYIQAEYVLFPEGHGKEG